MDERIEFLMQSIESHDRQLGEITDRIGEITDRIGEITDRIGENTLQIAQLADSVGKLVTVTNDDATAIRTLARIAESHERRLSAVSRC